MLCTSTLQQQIFLLEPGELQVTGGNPLEAPEIRRLQSGLFFHPPLPPASAWPRAAATKAPKAMGQREEETLQ